MQGTILILDGVATNRIMLKVQLTAAWYHVVQGNGVDGILPLVRRTRPDLILCAMSLPDGDAIDVREALQSDDSLADIPIIAVTPENDRAARLRALGAGLDDVLSHPYNDVVLLARIRSLIRAHAKSEELKVQDGSQTFGFGEQASGFDAQPASALIAVVTRSPGTGSLWRSRLSNTGSHRFTLHKFDDLHKLVTASAPDAFVIELSSDQSSLRLLADLRARSFTRNAVIIGVPHPGNRGIAAEALDRGADDVMPAGFDERELVLRLDTQLRRKARTDRMRTQLRDGMRAALLDPMTGLHNRRYALPELHRIAGNAAELDTQFAVMIADLDHFKDINDTYGHSAGDLVLIETANRLRQVMRASDLIARVGGEEFMMVMPATQRGQALRMADRLCRRINSEPYRVPGHRSPINVTTSVGVAIGPGHGPRRFESLRDVPLLMQQADRALYEAKGAGRNQVSMIAAAA